MMSPICSMLMVNETMSVQRRLSSFDSASPRDLRQVELDRRVELVDGVVELAQLLGQAQVVVADHRHDAAQHRLDDVGLVQRLARGAARSRATAWSARAGRGGAAACVVGARRRARAASGRRVRPTRPVKPMKSIASTMLKPRWKATTCWCTSGTSCCSSTCTCGRKAMKSSAPATLKIRLPSGSAPHLRRARARSRASPARRCRCWRRGPGRAPPAAGIIAVRRERRDQQHDRQARVREHGEHRADERCRAGPRSARRRAARARAGDSVSGRVAATISCSASVIRPRPISDAADRADAAVLARDEDDDADEDEQRREPRQVEREDQPPSRWCRRRRRA